MAISNADEQGKGEVLCRGRCVFMGYFKDEPETMAAIDQKGFVHSGDIGVLNQRDCLAITGRIKELIMTSGGENVAPVRIEGEISAALPIFSHVVVVGDYKKYLSALLCLKLRDEKHLDDSVVEYLSERGCPAKTINEVMACPEARLLIQEGIERANKKATSRVHQVRKFTILPMELSVDGGQLTPTLKVKRKIISQQFKAQIDSMYADPKL